MSAGTPPPPATVAQALNAQALRFIESQRSLGYTDPVISRQLTERYPGLTTGGVNALLARATRAEGAAVWLRALPNTPLSAGDVDRPLPGCTRWRYVTRVHWTDSAGDPRFTMYAYSNTHSQSANVLDTLVRNSFTQWLTANAQSSNPNYVGVTDFAVQNVEVLAVERACP